MTITCIFCFFVELDPLLDFFFYFVHKGKDGKHISHHELGAVMAWLLPVEGIHLAMSILEKKSGVIDTNGSRYIDMDKWPIDKTILNN